MADDVVLSAAVGTGATAATDQVAGGQHYQKIKLADGTADSTTMILAGGGVESGALRVTVASDSTGVLSVDDNGSTLSVDDGGGSLTVDGTVAATQSGTWTVQPGNTANTTAWKVDASSVAVPVTDNSGSLTVDNGGTFAVQATVAASATNIAKAEDAASADADVGVPALAVRKATPANTSGTDGDYEFLQMSAGRLWTSTTVDTALPAGTNAIGKLAANSGVTIGAIEVAAAQTLATVTTVSTVTTCSTLTGSGIAHDGVDSGNPHKIGAKAETSPKGITLVADGDRSDLYCDADGILMVKTGTAYGDLISERVSNTDGASTAFSTFGATANTRNFVTQITVHNAHATTNGYVDIRDGTGGSVLWTIPAPATGGATIHFNPPLRQPTANTALAYDVSAAITTVYISVNGFQSKA